MDRVAVAVGLLALVGVAAALLRRRSPGGPQRIDPRDVGLGGSGVGVVGFSTPFCAACRSWEAALATSGVAFAKVDLSERPELAARYGVTATPLVVAISLPEGKVLESYDGEPEVGQVEHLRELAGATPAPA